MACGYTGGGPGQETPWAGETPGKRVTIENKGQGNDNTYLAVGINRSGKCLREPVQRYEFQDSL